MKVESLDAALRTLRDPFGGEKPRATDFASQLTALVRGADAEQKAAESQAADLAADRGDVVETMVALSKAELSLRTVAEARNRALEAFHEIMRLQV
jgi:flagellar hook-basal body complex protein FliE